MSAQPYESTAPEGGGAVVPTPEPYAGQAQATVDVLPTTPGRKQPKTEPAPLAPEGFVSPPSAPQDLGPEPVDPTWGAPAPLDPTWAAPVTEAAPPAPLVYTGSIPPPVSVPVFPGGGVPSAEVPTAEPVQVPMGETPDDGPADAPSAKRFLGMQLRRPRRGDVLDENAVEPGPSAPVAAWPTDVGVAVVATAEPAAPAPWGPPKEPAEPVEYAGQDLIPAAQEPVGVAAAQPAVDMVPVEATVDAASAEAAPVEPAQVEAAVPTAVEPVVAAEPVVVAAPVVVAEPMLLPEPLAAAGPVVTVEPIATPVPVPAADDELRGLRTSLEAGDARRVAAEQRADNAVAYAQQLQAELTEVRADLEAKVQAAEVRIRTVANESQDWQIRHREAQAQIAELATSLSGAEQRLAEVRAERDELMTQLEEATAPGREDVAAELDA